MAFVVGPSKNRIVQAAFAGLRKEQRAASKVKEKPEVPAPRKKAAKKKARNAK